MNVLSTVSLCCRTNHQRNPLKLLITTTPNKATKKTTKQTKNTQTKVNKFVFFVKVSFLINFSVLLTFFTSNILYTKHTYIFHIYIYICVSTLNKNRSSKTCSKCFHVLISFCANITTIKPINKVNCIHCY